MQYTDDNLQKLDNDGEYEKIVELLSPIPEEQRGYDRSLILAQAQLQLALAGGDRDGLVADAERGLARTQVDGMLDGEWWYAKGLLLHAQGDLYDADDHMRMAQVLLEDPKKADEHLKKLRAAGSLLPEPEPATDTKGAPDPSSGADAKKPAVKPESAGSRKEETSAPKAGTVSGGQSASAPQTGSPRKEATAAPKAGTVSGGQSASAPQTGSPRKKAETASKATTVPGGQSGSPAQAGKPETGSPRKATAAAPKATTVPGAKSASPAQAGTSGTGSSQKAAAAPKASTVSGGQSASPAQTGRPETGSPRKAAAAAPRASTVPGAKGVSPAQAGKPETGSPRKAAATAPRATTVPGSQSASPAQAGTPGTGSSQKAAAAPRPSATSGSQTGVSPSAQGQEVKEAPPVTPRRPTYWWKTPAPSPQKPRSTSWTSPGQGQGTQTPRTPQDFRGTSPRQPWTQGQPARSTGTPQTPKGPQSAIPQGRPPYSETKTDGSPRLGKGPGQPGPQFRTGSAQGQGTQTSRTPQDARPAPVRQPGGQNQPVRSARAPQTHQAPKAPTVPAPQGKTPQPETKTGEDARNGKETVSPSREGQKGVVFEPGMQIPRHLLDPWKPVPDAREEQPSEDLSWGAPSGQAGQAPAQNVEPEPARKPKPAPVKSPKPKPAPVEQKPVKQKPQKPVLPPKKKEPIPVAQKQSKKAAKKASQQEIPFEPVEKTPYAPKEEEAILKHLEKAFRSSAELFRCGVQEEREVCFARFPADSPVGWQTVITLGLGQTPMTIPPVMGDGDGARKERMELVLRFPQQADFRRKEGRILDAVCSLVCGLLKDGGFVVQGTLLSLAIPDSTFSALLIGGTPYRPATDCPLSEQETIRFHDAIVLYGEEERFCRDDAQVKKLLAGMEATISTDEGRRSEAPVTITRSAELGELQRMEKLVAAGRLLEAVRVYERIPEQNRTFRQALRYVQALDSMEAGREAMARGLALLESAKNRSCMDPEWQVQYGLFLRRNEMWSKAAYWLKRAMGGTARPDLEVELVECQRRAILAQAYTIRDRREIQSRLERVSDSERWTRWMSHRVEGLELLGFVFRPETGTGAWQALCTLGAGNRIPEDTGHESIGRVELFLTLPADLSLGARSTDFDLGVGFSGLLKDLVQQSWNGSGLFPGCWFPFPDTVKMKEFGGTMITRLPEDVVETDMTLKSGKEVTFCRLMLLRTEEIGALKAKPEKAEEAARLLRDVPFGQEMARPAVKI